MGGLRRLHIPDLGEVSMFEARASGTGLRTLASTGLDWALVTLIEGAGIDATRD